MKLVHCSYHKCLTVYYSRVFSRLYNKILFLSRGYKHFNSLIDDYYEQSDKFKIASVNNHALDLQKLGSDFRISRFMRDPRDLIVSGYFYHKRGAEAWSNIVDPNNSDWQVVNGCIPRNLGKGNSFSSYLQGLSTEDGLIAEIDFRAKHFDSMSNWPTSDPRIKVFRYEDIVNNETQVFDEILRFYGVTWLERRIGLKLAKKFSAKNQSKKSKHIRNTNPSQWKEHFTPRLRDYFEQKYAGLLERYGYDWK